MRNKLKDTDTKIHTTTFSTALLISKNFDLNKIKIGKNSYKNIFIYYIRY